MSMQGHGRPRIIVGVSGGVDSSVAALRLVQEKEAVAGLFMQNWADDGSGECDEGRESLGQFIVASGDTAKLLDPTEESLDEISTFVAALVELTLNATDTASQMVLWKISRQFPKRPPL